MTKIMTIRRFLSAALVVLLVSLAAPTIVSAQYTPVNTGPGNTGGTNTGVTLLNPLQAGTSLSSFLSDILQFVINIGTIVVILMLVFVGYKFVVAQGKPGEIEAAKKMLLWTIVGALVLLGAQAISSAIQATVAALGA